MSKFKVGDKVVIIPRDAHVDKVKPFYDKQLHVIEVVEVRVGMHMYKVGGVPGYAEDDDIELA